MFTPVPNPLIFIYDYKKKTTYSQLSSPYAIYQNFQNIHSGSSLATCMCVPYTKQNTWESGYHLFHFGFMYTFLFLDIIWLWNAQ